MAKRSESDWPGPWTLLLVALVTTIVIMACLGCRGPYVGPDVVPDRLEVGRIFGDTASSGAISDVNYAWPVGGSSETELWSVSLGWDLTTDPVGDLQREERVLAALEGLAEAEPEPVVMEAPEEGVYVHPVWLTSIIPAIGAGYYARRKRESE